MGLVRPVSVVLEWFPMCRVVNLGPALTTLAGITSRQQRGGADHSVQEHYKLWLVGFMGRPHGNACRPLASPCLDCITVQMRLLDDELCVTAGILDTMTASRYLQHSSGSSWWMVSMEPTAYSRKKANDMVAQLLR